MKKAFSFLTTICFLFIIATPISAAETQEDLFLISGTDDGLQWLYICLHDDIRGVADDWTVRFDFCIKPEENTALPKVDADKLHCRLPDAANGSGVELFIPIEDDTYSILHCDMTVSGLLDNTGTATERTYTMGTAKYDDNGNWNEIHANYHAVSLKAEIPDPDTSVTINYYNGNIDLNADILARREQEAHAPRYCFVGDTITFAADLPKSLMAHASLECDGVQMEQTDVTHFNAVCGEGTATLHLSPYLHYTVPFWIGTKKEMRSMVLQTMLRHPLDVSKVWLNGAALLGSFAVFPFGGLFLPVLYALAAVTAPLGNVLLIVWTAISFL